MEEQVNDADRRDADERDVALAVIAAKLGAKVDRLTDAVDRLDKRYAVLESRTGTVERRSARTVAGALLVVAALVIGGLLGYSQVVTSDRLSTVVEDQRRVTQEVLCPLFALVLGGYDPDSRPAGAARDQYVQAFGEFSRLYTKLQCTAPTVPPREPGS